MPQLQSTKSLIYVTANRNKGVSKKTGNDYDMATIEVSDGIASLELPLNPNAHTLIASSFNRGDKINIIVDVNKNFGRAAFEVIEVQKA